jgi:hypothetical protein
MKTINRDEIKINSIISKIEDRRKEVKEMISWLNEWKDSRDMERILLNDIFKARIEINMLEMKLKVMKVIQGFKNKVTA